jgi:hypothetical protein
VWGLVFRVEELGLGLGLGTGWAEFLLYNLIGLSLVLPGKDSRGRVVLAVDDALPRLAVVRIAGRRPRKSERVGTVSGIDEFVRHFVALLRRSYQHLDVSPHICFFKPPALKSNWVGGIQ